MFARRIPAFLLITLLLGLAPDHRALVLRAPEDRDLVPGRAAALAEPATSIPLFISEAPAANSDPVAATLNPPEAEVGAPARPILKPASASSNGGIEQITLLEGSLKPGLMSGELVRLASLTAKASSDRLWQGSFLLPLNGPVTTPFGTPRSYDGSAPGPHLGIDVAGPAGAAVLASNAGIVAFAGQWDVRGNAVLLDHGQGVYSGYYHLALPTVTAGQSVKKGEIVGAVGATGLATGPHVHWDMIVRGVHVSPLDWIEAADMPAIAGPWPMVDLPMEVLAVQTPHRLVPEVVEALSRRDAVVRDTYHSMLGTDPAAVAEDEVRRWTESDLSTEQLREAIVSTAKLERTSAIRKLYRSLLGWEPADDDPALTSWVQSGLTIGETQVGIVHAGMPDRRIAIRRLYVQVLGWDPLGLDDGGLDVWAESGLSLDEIYEALSNSDEAQARG